MSDQTTNIRRTYQFSALRWLHLAEQVKAAAWQLDVKLTIIGYKRGLVHERLHFGIEGDEKKVTALIKSLGAMIDEYNSSIDAILQNKENTNA